MTLNSKLIQVLTISALVFIYSCKPKNHKDTKVINDKNNISKTDGMVYVCNDTITEKYQFMIDGKKKIEELDRKLKAEYEGKVNAFQNEYNNYLKIGASLSLVEQKKKEASLQEKQKTIMQLEQELGAKLSEETQKINKEINDSVSSFLKRYNKKKNYTYIFGYTPGLVILYANEKNDITKEVLVGLNEEYKNWKK